MFDFAVVRLTIMRGVTKSHLTECVISLNFEDTNATIYILVISAYSKRYSYDVFDIHFDVFGQHKNFAQSIDPSVRCLCKVYSKLFTGDNVRIKIPLNMHVCLTTVPHEFAKSNIVFLNMLALLHRASCADLWRVSLAYDSTAIHVPCKYVYTHKQRAVCIHQVQQMCARQAFRFWSQISLWLSFHYHRWPSQLCREWL